MAEYLFKEEVPPVGTSSSRNFRKFLFPVYFF